MTPPHIKRILDLARWAPSGDNTQPWRFEVVDGANFIIHGHDTRDWCVYDLDGRASQIAIGALLETVFIAASGEGMRTEFNRQADAPESNPVIEVRLIPDPTVSPSPLLPFIETRTTQRRPMSTAPLTAEQRRKLERSVDPGFRVVWIEGASARWRMAKLLYKNAGIRLTIPEAYEVHRRIIEWDARYSVDRIPDQAVGLDPLALKLMRWAMQSWERVRFLNRYLAGTLLPRLQLDLIPGLRCGAHFAIVASGPMNSIEDFLDGGRAVQRFWLTATGLGLQIQPEMTPLIFARYVRVSRKFTSVPKANRAVSSLAAELDQLFGPSVAANGVFVGRVGEGKPPTARSLRRDLGELVLPRAAPVSD
jgi:sulfur-carrier protein adenylyltransferase/sulfurtransferase